jgi:XTP/dITP diphosphohydrolase
VSDRQGAAGAASGDTKVSLGKVVLASNNAGKLREFAALLDAAGIELIAQGTLNVPEAEEPYPTFVENALTKARHAAKLTGLPALADDSGLCVAALRGAPGVYSARYAQLAGGPKSDAANNARLVAEMLTISACWRSYVTLMIPSRCLPKVAGTARSSTRRAARTASAMTRTSFCRNSARPPPNSIRP